MDSRLARSMYLRSELLKRGHNEYYCGFQCGLVFAGYHGEALTDDTCAIITSSEYIASC